MNDLPKDLAIHDPNWPDSTPAEAFRGALSRKTTRIHRRYFVFGSDHRIYGPATTPLLKKWFDEGRIDLETWVYDEAHAAWKYIAEMEAFRDRIAIHHAKRPATSHSSFNWIRRIRAFANLDDDEIDELVPRLRKHQVFSMETMVNQNVEIGSVYFIYSGSVELLMNLNDNLRVVELLQKGDVFGELALAEKTLSPYVVRAKDISVLFSLKHSDCRLLMHSHPNLAVKLLSSIMLEVSIRLNIARRQLAVAKSLVRGSLGRTGKVVMPVVKEIRKGPYPAKLVRKKKFGHIPSPDFDPTFFDA